MVGRAEARSVGTSAHTSSAYGQRGWNRHPVGGWCRSGGLPGIPVMTTRSPESGGNEPIRPVVYGWAGRAKRADASASSMMSPAYMIAIRSENSTRSDRSCVMKSTANPSSR